MTTSKMPQSAGRAFSQKDLPPSVETAYYRKCIELRRRINDIEENNDGTRLRIKRLNRTITKMRLERAFLLEQLHKHMEYNVDDSDRSSSPPPTPTDKPLRSKRSHRKTTPTGGTHLGSGLPGAQHPSPSGGQQQQISHALNPLSSAQSTPDPSRSNPFFSTIPPAASSPHAVNGTGQPVLPPLHPSHLQPLHPQRPAHGVSDAPRGTFFDAAYDEQRPAEHDPEYTGRRRAHSSAHPPPAEAIEGQNGERRDQDTEMGDAPPADAAGFTAVNR
ncbi:uncharacterized protein BDR25DRAFT_1933 [Lindgomyces ingoldianus]|uniref:Uncharacterized protein n=1 Tax=Lindgomyces ingoldianus TaxID=673940 RepID=A0ACB6RE69_9PLEO|nr:uncharacterized protein BDR25DRAFT_1933 [Lindgomyces ingoldianus]KAF2477539.1 hypothetical protein BDR25DRAFT_1933 [Lindgomyces ingoldianus]